MNVLFPFGHGLSYTSFSYGNLKADKGHIKESETVQVTVEVTNTGNRPGKEVVQLYVSPKNSRMIRPVRELKAFEKMELQPGETKTAVFPLDARAFACWNTDIHDWFVETGSYELQIGKSAEQIILSKEIQVESEKSLPRTFTLNSTLGEIMADPKGQAVLSQAMGGMMAGTQAEQMADQAQGDGSAINDEMMAATMEGMPLRQMLSFIPGMKKESLEQLISALNA